LLRGFLRQVNGDVDKRFVHLVRDLRDALGSESVTLEALRLYQEEKKMKYDVISTSLSDLSSVLVTAVRLYAEEMAGHAEEGPDDGEPDKDEQKERN